MYSSSNSAFDRSDRVRDRFDIIELAIGLTELGIGLIELGIDLLELEINQRINKARCIVLAHVSGLVFSQIELGRYS